MKKNDQIRALIGAYTELAERQNYSERSTMEALLDFFTRKNWLNWGIGKGS